MHFLPSRDYIVGNKHLDLLDSIHNIIIHILSIKHLKKQSKLEKHTSKARRWREGFLDRGVNNVALRLCEITMDNIESEF